MPARLENEMEINKKIELKLKSMPSYVTEWHNNLRASNKTAASRRDMVYKVYNFLEYIDKNTKKVEVDKINSVNVTQYYISIATKIDNNGNLSSTSDSYRQGVYCALKNFLGFMTRNGYIDKNYIEEIEKPRNHDLERINKNRIKLTKEDFISVINEVSKENNLMLRYRDMAMLKIFMSTGMRRTALKIINISDIDFENKTLATIDKGKGGTVQVYPLNNETVETLKEWLKYRKKCHGAKSDALFLSNRGTRISDKGIYKTVNKYFDKAIGKKLSPHKIRAGVASILYEETGDIEFVRRSIGHLKVETTQRYITTNNDERMQAAKILEF